jgi:nitroimidazol reductase NimA-like FMN-containing flavoprotein (pyridoxamine 5'-phosphate oxidase superfamily)
MHDQPYPYVVPLNFVYHEGHLYFHCAAEGRKIDLLRSNRRVCFELDHQESIVPGPSACAWGTRYRSVIGTGEAVMVLDEAEKRKGLSCLMQKYAGNSDFRFSDRELRAVVVFRIEIHEMTGKSS